MGPNQEKRLTHIDLFAGCGGLSLGLEEAGFFPLFVNELNEDAMRSYLMNRTKFNPLLEKKYNVSDVKQLVLNDELRTDLVEQMERDYKISFKDGDLDLLVGGPPCQGYSGIGHRRSYSVERQQVPSNHLYEDMAFLISRLRPKLFLFENVKGLLTARWSSGGRKSEIWDDVREKFSDLDEYEVKWTLVHAKNYGTPQNRPRVLLVGVRKDSGIPVGDSDDAIEAGLIPKSGKPAPHIEDLLGDLLDPHYENGGETNQYPTDPINELQENLRRDPQSGHASKSGDPLTEHQYSKHRSKIIEKFKYMIDNKGDIPESMRTKKFAQRVLPNHWENGPTITATSLPDDYVHYAQPRIPTVREWARIQMFPDWYRFSGKRTTGGLRRAGNPRQNNFDRELPKYTQIGNAVPVSLATAVGEHFRQLLRSTSNIKSE